MPFPFARIPVITLVLCAAALIVNQLPDVSVRIQFDRGALAAGEWWRVATCHFAHWSADHFAYDFMAFAALCGSCEVTSRRRTLIAIAGSILAIPLAILAFQPQMQTYRGLSGLDSALFALLAFDLLREKVAAADRRSALAIGLLIIAFLVKTLIETTTGATLFADSAAGGFVPVPLAHLVGFAIGGITAVAFRDAGSLATRNTDYRFPRAESPRRAATGHDALLDAQN